MSESLPIGAAWLVSAVMVHAAWIDGREHRVPNWLTVPLALCGLAFWAGRAGLPGLAEASLGMLVGLAFLGLMYWYGWVGGGDVKLFAGFGAWVGPALALDALAAGMVIGGVLALGMIARGGEWRRHWRTAVEVVREVAAVRHPDRASELAARRKPTLTLLPYGVPLTIGAIATLARSGLLY